MSETSRPAPPSARRFGAGALVLVLALGLALGGGGIWFLGVHRPTARRTGGGGEDPLHLPDAPDHRVGSPRGLPDLRHGARQGGRGGRRRRARGGARDGPHRPAAPAADRPADRRGLRGPVGSSWKTVGRVSVDETNVHHVNIKVAGFVDTVYVELRRPGGPAGEAAVLDLQPGAVSVQQEYLIALNGRGRRWPRGIATVPGTTWWRPARERLGALGHPGERGSAAERDRRADEDPHPALADERAW